MQVRFWGTRGSIAKPGPTTVRYGGNTSCVQVTASDGTLVILDCGTGAHGLGQHLMATLKGPLRGHILIGHTHWDHIQGFPFFAPLFVPGNEWDIYAPRGLSQQLQETLAGQMDYTYFPVSLKQLGATLRYHDLVEGVFTLGGITVNTQYLNHPALTLGYRLEADGTSVVYATDHEPHSRQAAMPETTSRHPDFPHYEDQRHAAFLKGADLLIHDTQYTAAEYPQHHGWGHSTVEYVVDMALASDIQQLALFHHDPNRTDEAVDRLVEAARQRLASVNGHLELFAAAEGQILDLGLDASEAIAHRIDPLAPDAEIDLRGRAVLLSLADPASRRAIEEAVRQEGMVPCEACTPDLPREIERLEAILAFVDRPAATSLGIPTVLITPTDDAAATVPEVDDSLTTPFSPAYVRTRLRAWLRRACPRWVAAPHPSDEPSRLDHVHRLNLLDTPAEERFDRFARLAERAFSVPVAMLSLIDGDRQWVKTPHPLLECEVPRDISMGAHAMLRDEPLLVPDGRVDATYGDNPAFTEHHFRFYAGVALKDADQVPVGTLCLFDYRPRHFTPSDLALLQDLAELAGRELVLSKVAHPSA